LIPYLLNIETVMPLGFFQTYNLQKGGRTLVRSPFDFGMALMYRFIGMR